MAVLGIVAFGITCRLAQYASHRSFWHDEAFLVLNILEKSAAELSGPLDALPGAPQSAAPGFLWAERLLATGLGGSEWVLRLVPLFLGLASLALFARLAWRFLSPAVATWAVALFALSDRLIWHACEVKPYSGDVFAAVVLTSLALGEDEGRTAVRRLIRVSAVSALAVWFSYSAILVYAGIALALAPRIIGGRPRWRVSCCKSRGINPLPPCGGGKGGGDECAVDHPHPGPPPSRGREKQVFQTFLNTTLGRYLACHLPVLVSFALLYWAAIRRQRSPILASYWAEQFPDWHRVLELPAWLVASLVELCNYPYKPAGIAILGLAVAGGLALCRQGKAGLLAVLAAPVVVTLLAACAGQYPFGGSRLTVFLAPAVFLLAGAGVGGIGQRLPPRWSRWWWLLPGTLLAWGLAQAAYHLAVPRTRSHMRPAVEYLRAHRQPGEGIYALYTHGAVFRCYWRQPEPRLRLEMDPVQAIPWRRFWIVFAFPPRRGFREMQPVLDEVQTGAELRDQFVVAGGAALLFEIPPAGEATADGARAGEARAGEAPPGGHPLFSPR